MNKTILSTQLYTTEAGSSKAAAHSELDVPDPSPEAATAAIETNALPSGYPAEVLKELEKQ